jgi:hypothetical protein
VTEAPGVRFRLERGTADHDRVLTVTNDRAVPVRFEAEFDNDSRALASGTRLARRNGQPLWQVTVPANGSAILRYRLPVMR